MRSFVFGIVVPAVALAAAIGGWWFYRHHVLMRPLRIAAGGAGYSRIAEGIAHAVGKKPAQISVAVANGSEGSVDNLRMLLAGDADLALMQSDTQLVDLAGDKTPDSEDPDAASVRLIAPLYREVLHILVRNAPGVQPDKGGANCLDLRDLEGKTVLIGARHSGTARTVHRLLAHYELTEKDYTPVHMNLEEYLRERHDAPADRPLAEPDVCFVMSGLNCEPCQRLLESGKYHLAGFRKAQSGEGSEADGFCAAVPAFFPSAIPPGLYGCRTVPDWKPKTAISTIGVYCLLVCRKDMSVATARAVTEAIYQNRRVIALASEAGTQINEDFKRMFFAYPLHEGAEAYYAREAPGLWQQYSQSLQMLSATAVTIVSFGLWCYRRLKMKDRIDVYYDEVLGILQHLDDAAAMEERELAALRHRLVELRKRAFRQLAEEKLRADESFLVFYSLLQDCQHHLRYLHQRLLAGTGHPPPHPGP